MKKPVKFLKNSVSDSSSSDSSSSSDESDHQFRKMHSKHHHSHCYETDSDSDFDIPLKYQEVKITPLKSSDDYVTCVTGRSTGSPRFGLEPKTDTESPASRRSSVIGEAALSTLSTWGPA